MFSKETEKRRAPRHPGPQVFGPRIEHGPGTRGVRQCWRNPSADACPCNMGIRNNLAPHKNLIFRKIMLDKGK
jgi:hypothetical protein